MHPHSLCRLLFLGLLTLLLPACAGLQQRGSLALADPVTSARQEQLADLLLGAGRVVLALESYDKALLARPGDAGLRVKKGRALLRLNQPEAALAEFRQALAARPELAAAQHGAGVASLRLGRHAEAREAFQNSVALAPDNWRSRSHLGLLLLRAGQTGQAQEQFLAALALPQFQPQVLANAGSGREELLNNLGLAQVLAGDSETAVRTFRQALHDARDPERSANNLGLLLVRLGRPAEALSAFRASGNDARALNNLGYALYLQGNTQKAQALFEKALDLSPAYYETAGENLKLAVQGTADDSSGTPHSSGSQGAAADRSGAKADGTAAVAQGLARLSLRAQSGPALRFGPATLLGSRAPQQWTY